MFVLFLKFSENKAQAGQFTDGHNEWLRRGFDDGVFVLAGGLQPSQGGAVLAHNATLVELQDRVSGDPFVANGVVTAEVLEISVAKADERLSFLLG